MFECTDRRGAERQTQCVDLINSPFIQLIPALLSDRHFSEEHKTIKLSEFNKILDQDCCLLMYDST